MNYNKKTVRDVDVAGKTVLCRVDINQPVDKASGTLRSTALYCLLISLIGFVFCYPKQLPDAENKEK